DVRGKLTGSADAEVRRLSLALSLLFGDAEALSVLKKTAADPGAATDARRDALQLLVEKRPDDLPPLLRTLVADRAVRGAAIRGLAAYGDREAPGLILRHYGSYTDAEKA